MKNLIIGGASNYGWNQLKHWVNSIKKSGFDGDIVLVATNMSKETIDKLVEAGVQLELYGISQDDGSIIAHSKGAPHVERFFYIWNFLNKTIGQYNYVIATDTRDVIFQSDPTVWLDQCLKTSNKKFVISSEGLKYQDEPWGNQNLLEAFGPYFHDQYKSRMIYNVGTLAGYSEYICDLLFMIFQMSINRPIPIVDQAVYNVLLQQNFFYDNAFISFNSSAWAIQLGTTIQAVRSGAGDLGANAVRNPTALIDYQAKYLDDQPDIDEEGYIVNAQGNRFAIVHQYDRCGFWKDKIMERYND